jgi:hypothetical protein
MRLSRDACECVAPRHHRCRASEPESGKVAGALMRVSCHVPLMHGCAIYMSAWHHATDHIYVCSFLGTAKWNRKYYCFVHSLGSACMHACACMCTHKHIQRPLTHNQCGAIPCTILPCAHFSLQRAPHHSCAHTCTHACISSPTLHTHASIQLKNDLIE